MPTTDSPFRLVRRADTLSAELADSGGRIERAIRILEGDIDADVRQLLGRASIGAGSVSDERVLLRLVRLLKGVVVTLRGAL